VGTTISDGITTCQWFQLPEDGIQYCGNGCDMNGCGETTCDADDGGDAAPPPALTSDDDALCAQSNSCYDCVGTTLSDGVTTCQWFPGIFAEDGLQYCASKCDIDGCGETTCPAPTADDDALCTQSNSCYECVGITLSDGVTTCQWFQFAEDGVQYCASKCDMNGCGETTCDADAPPPAPTADDDALCAQSNSCYECVETTLSDEISTCQWFQFAEDGLQYCASKCDMNGCGETTCDADDGGGAAPPPAPTSPQVDGNKEPPTTLKSSPSSASVRRVVSILTSDVIAVLIAATLA
jgi:uncharacterized protein YodC (DUF2158 family)